MSGTRDDESAPADRERKRLDELEKVFAAALAATGDSRTAVLDALCGSRADLRAEVELLLAAHDHAGAFIAPHTISPIDLRLGEEPADGSTDRRIGAFRLLQRIARGGMGEVYRAERVEGGFTQQVAIKLIAARIHDTATVRRFEAERQILASLQHPNIVSLLDGGVTPEGQPYIVMEFVDGVPIAEFCRARALSIRARLSLFQQLCAAVTFAHRHLVVHRDLKPANVVVTGDGLVKVLDFGVAKLLEPESFAAATTLSLVGPLTPDYASPEQIKGLPTTTACDVYALGVMLYELLAGGRPYDTAGKTLDEIVTVVVNAEPQRPSTVCGAALPYEARVLRGDLDAVVLKAMAKTTEKRYDSAEQLSADLTRFLESRPVRARNPSRMYQLRRMVARHRTAFAFTALFAVLLSAAVLGALWQARIASRERERALQRFNDVRELASALIFRIHDEVAPLAGSTPVRQTIIAEGLRFLERLEADAAGEPALQLELSRAYMRIASVQGTLNEANLGNREQAIRSYRRARDIAAALPGSGLDPWDVVAALVEANMRLSEAVEGEEGTGAARAALAAARAWERRERRSIRTRVLLARAHFRVALRETHTAKLPYWLEANRLFAGVFAESPDDLTIVRYLARTEKYLGSYFDIAGEHERALEHYMRARELDERRVRARPNDRQALIDLAIDIGSIGFMHAFFGRLDEAIAANKQSLELRERVAASDPTDVYARGRVAYTHTELATLLLESRQYAAVRKHASTAVELTAPLVHIHDEYRVRHAIALQKLGEADWREGRREEACRLYARAMTHFQLVPRGFVTGERTSGRDVGAQRLAMCTRQ